MHQPTPTPTDTNQPNTPPPKKTNPKAERRLAEEVDRVKLYLDASTEPKITRVVENELVREQVGLLSLEGGVIWGFRGDLGVSG